MLRLRWRKPTPAVRLHPRVRARLAEKAEGRGRRTDGTIVCTACGHDWHRGHRCPFPED